MDDDRSTGNQPDGVWISRTLEGDLDAFAPLVRKYEVMVKTMVAQRVGAWADVDDVAQDIFVKAYTRLAQYRGAAAFSTWLYRLTINHCWDVLRSVAGRQEESLEALPPGVRAEAEIRAAREPEGHAVDWEARRRRVAAALNALPDPQREILILREIEGRAYDEIAALLGIALGTVESRLFRARRALQARLGDKEEQE